MVETHVNIDIEKNKNWDFEAILVTAKGNERWVRSLGYPIYKDGKLIELRGSFMDIDKRKREEEVSKRNQLLFERIFNTVEMLVCLHEPDGIYKKVSASSQSILGYSNDEMIGNNPYTYFHPDDIQHIPDESHRQLLDGNADVTRIEYRIRHKKGHYLWFLTVTSLFKDEQGQITELLTTSMDITERKLLEDKVDELNKSLKLDLQQRIRSLDEANLELRQQMFTMDEVACVAALSKDRKFTYVNNAFCETTGYTSETLIGQDVTMIYAAKKSDDWHDQRWEMLDKGKVWRGEVRYKTKSGETVWVKSTISPFFDLDGNIDKYIQVDFDISEIKNLSRQLEARAKLLEKSNSRLAQANKELESFSYSVSHDLKAPLRALKGFSTNLQKVYSDKLDDTAKKWIGYISQNAETLDQVISDMLSFSRVSRATVNKGQVSMNAVVDDVIDQFADPLKNSILSVADLGHAPCDDTMIKLVWQNLIGNAVKYSAKGRSLELKIWREDADDAIRFYIQDNGIGFENMYAEKIFETFQRLHRSDEFEGSGIGLANVKRIIEKHNGSVGAEGELGTGAKFYFELPQNT
ncbi:MAG: hypothetical protein Salg2KO_10880 [Salibacteraceae bacterium]